MQVSNQANLNEKPQVEASNYTSIQKKGKNQPFISHRTIIKKEKKDHKRILTSYKKQSARERIASSTLDSTDNSSNQQGSIILDLRHAFAKFDLMEMEESGSFISGYQSPNFEQQSGGSSVEHSDESFFRINQDEISGSRGRTQSFEITSNTLDFELENDYLINQVSARSTDSLEFSVEQSESYSSIEFSLEVKKIVKHPVFCNQILPGCRVQTIFDFRMGITGQGLIPYKDPLNFVHDSKFEDDLIAALT